MPKWGSRSEITLPKRIRAIRYEAQCETLASVYNQSIADGPAPLKPAWSASCRTFCAAMPARLCPEPLGYPLACP